MGGMIIELLRGAGMFALFAFVLLSLYEYVRPS